MHFHKYTSRYTPVLSTSLLSNWLGTGSDVLLDHAVQLYSLSSGNQGSTLAVSTHWIGLLDSHLTTKSHFTVQQSAILYLETFILHSQKWTPSQLGGGLTLLIWGCVHISAQLKCVWARKNKSDIGQNYPVHTPRPTYRNWLHNKAVGTCLLLLQGLLCTVMVIANLVHAGRGGNCLSCPRNYSSA